MLVVGTFQHQLYYDVLQNAATSGSLDEDKKDKELRAVPVNRYVYDAFWIMFVVHLFSGFIPPAITLLLSEMQGDQR